MAYESDANDLRQAPPASSDQTRPYEGINAAMAGWLGIALTIVAVVALVVMSGFSSKDSMDYAALVGTAILSVGLIALIVLSRAVGVTEPNAALGLPRGSIRALLALGLAIVFVSVASWTLGGLFERVGPLVTEATVANETERKAYWDRYPASDYIVRETVSRKATTDAGAAGKGGDAAKGGAVVAEPANFPRDLKIYLIRSTIDPGLLDLAKQILTISATVLVTIVGFYFGSNTSADAARTVRAIMSGSAPGILGAGETVPDAPDDVSKLSVAIAAISTGCDSKLQGLGSDPIGLLRQAVSEASADVDLTKKLQAAEQLYSDLKAKAAACGVDGARAKETVEGLGASATQPQIQQAGERLRLLKVEAEQVNQAFEQTLAQFVDAQKYILQKTAKG